MIPDKYTYTGDGSKSKKLDLDIPSPSFVWIKSRNDESWNVFDSVRNESSMGLQPECILVKDMDLGIYLKYHANGKVEIDSKCDEYEIRHFGDGKTTIIDKKGNRIKTL